MSVSAFQDLPLLDEPALNELREMLEDALSEITDSFLDGLDGEVAAVQGSLAQGGVALKASAHSLKGSSGNLGARRLAGLAAALEKAGMEGRMADAETLMPLLPPLAAETRDALRAYMAGG